MSISNEFTAPAPRERPGAVTAAGMGQFALFVLAVLATVASIVAAESALPLMTDQLRQNPPEGLSASEADTIVGLARALIYVFALIVPLYTLAVAIMGAFVLKGRNGARITTWVLSGIGLACTGVSAVSAPLSMMTPQTPTGPGTPDPEVFESAVPVWTDVLSITTTVLAAVLYLVIVILLALPVSNEYFRKHRPVEQLPGAAFPAPPPPEGGHGGWQAQSPPDPGAVDSSAPSGDAQPPPPPAQGHGESPTAGPDGPTPPPTAGPDGQQPPAQ